MNGATQRREAVAGNDGVWLQDSATNLMIINAVFTTDRIDLETVRESFRTRVLEADGGQRYPRFRRRVVWVRRKPYWEEDPAFDLARHIVSAPQNEVRTAEQLQAYVGVLADQPLTTDRPQWQFQHVEQFGTEESAIIVRVHHCMGDGIAFTSVIFAWMDELGATDGEQRIRSESRRPRPGRLATAIKAPLAAPFILLRRLTWRADRHALHGPRISGTKRVAWTAPLDLDVVKKVKDRLGATVNDVLMACVSGALGRHLERATGPAVDMIRISMPVNVRLPHTPLIMENRFAAVPLELPVGIRHIRDRVHAVKRRMDALKLSVEPIVVYGIVNILLKTLPQGVSRGLIDFLANKCTCVVTNVPGPQRALTLAGRRVRMMMFWVPQRADIGVGISILSFSGQVQVGVICDTHLVPDPAVIVQAFEEEFDALRAF